MTQKYYVDRLKPSLLQEHGNPLQSIRAGSLAQRIGDTSYSGFRPARLILLI